MVQKTVTTLTEGIFPQFPLLSIPTIFNANNVLYHRRRGMQNDEMGPVQRIVDIIISGAENDISRQKCHFHCLHWIVVQRDGLVDGIDQCNYTI